MLFSQLTADGEISTGVSGFGCIDLPGNASGEEASPSVGVRGGVGLDEEVGGLILASAGVLTAKEISHCDLDILPIGTIDRRQRVLEFEIRHQETPYGYAPSLIQIVILSF